MLVPDRLRFWHRVRSVRPPVLSPLVIVNEALRAPLLPALPCHLGDGKGGSPEARGALFVWRLPMGRTPP